MYRKYVNDFTERDEQKKVDGQMKVFYSMYNVHSEQRVKRKRRLNAVYRFLL